MRAMGRGALRVLRGGALPLGAALLLAGCASMPSGGEVRKVDNGQQADDNPRVLVYGIPPHPGESAAEIVSGFLEATTSGEPDFATAKKYLTRALEQRWDPKARITVLSSSPQSDGGTDFAPKATGVVIGVSGSKTAQVDAKHAYSPNGGAFHTSVHLVKQGNEWRIDRLDDGLILSASDFQRIYHSVNMYYFAQLGPDGQRSGSRQQTLVADPVYLRKQQTDSLADTVSALLGGPTTWLAPAVASAAPSGVRLYSKGTGQGVLVDDSQRLKVRLDKKADRLGHDQCMRLAAQLFATVQGQASAKLASAEVQRADGATICSLPSSQALTPTDMVGSTSKRYFIGSEQHQLYELAGQDTAASPVQGPFGSAKADLVSVAVRRDGEMAAGVRSDGHLVVGSFTDGDSFRASQLTSSAQNPKNGLSAPSWDGFDDLWVADRSPAISRLYVLPGGTGAPALVDVPGLEGRVESLRVASDGVRIVLVVDEGGNKTLQLGLIQRGGTLDQPQFSVKNLRDLTPAGESVSSVSWAGPSQLVMQGSDIGGGGQQIHYVSTDGSVAAALESIGEAVSVAASEDPTRPLQVASSNGYIYWLPDDSNWKRVTPKGGSPVYPG
ncbi:LpqB family beta-propeller domain-containing protein [Actinacidiphila paucisporea]|uniref:Lipoprotein LpqB beta-propeller domain-containing protein n=1 Tax=Actinacidiphila paucisporea TaxID=310782 RepID=A0A1M6W6U7_9ACTN|nr:LpqB family beta-propeller domain-containing protein [Actinacidiphila paucisporea]SHK89215.1 Lipoprotein LpqB beta-propeller domain-containing protein [Actinacidiphila paucisporea]